MSVNATFADFDSSVKSGSAAEVARPEECARLLQQHGWRETRGGKHVVKMEKEGARPITLPHHSGKAYGKALTAAILRQAGLQ